MLHNTDQPLVGFSKQAAKRQRALEDDLCGRLCPERFRQHLEAISSEPHPAGSAANERVASYLAGVMRAAGWQVELPAYDAYLPLASSSYVALVTPVRRPLNQQENILPDDPYSAHADLMPAWLAYTGSGDVTGQVVYANYGRLEDFSQLRRMGVDLAGKVVIARYGGNFRGYKARYAEKAGAAALLIYSDPADGGYANGPPYPEGRWLNDSAVQRGSLQTLPYPGDPLTPDGPAVTEERGVPPRLAPEQVDLPRIPVAALPYASASEIIARMSGESVPKGWRGGLPHAYRLTGGSDLTVRVQVEQTCGLRRIANVIGTLPGEVEPDRWIVLGCHYDAWTFGTADPNSGTAALLLLAEALGAQARAGSRPRRSILIAHWDAEELGMIGSVEWVEEHLAEVRRSAVAYLNADMAATGPSFGAAAAPLLRGPVAAAADSVSALEGEGSAYAQWVASSQADGPNWSIPGGGSDHVGFLARAGVPVAQASFSSPVPVYHSAYDNLSWYERFADPEFASGPTLAAVDGLLALRLANAEILPLDAGAWPSDLDRHLDRLVARAEELGVAVDLTLARSAVRQLQSAADGWEQAREAYLGSPDLPVADLAAVNDRLASLERQFLCDAGLPERSWYRSQYAAPDPVDGYATWPLPALRHTVEACDPDAAALWQERLVASIERVCTLLDEARAYLAR